jgi:hypothetical protein
MHKSSHLIKLCFTLSFLAILFLVSLQFSVCAQDKETYESVVPSCEKFSLKNSNFFRISALASTVISDDFNNDGIPDVAAPMPNTNSIAVALGDNQNGFSASRDFIAGVSPQSAVSGDFNRDGEIDLAVTSKSDRQLNILLGDGKGNFELTKSYPVGNSPDEIQTADFNNDNWLDIAVGNIDSNSISIYLGGANGFIAAQTPAITLDSRPISFALADFNRDNKIDLITVASPNIRLFSGDGQGNFSNTLTFESNEVYSIVSADFNNDNYPDFAYYGYRDSKLYVYVNNRTGGFNRPSEITVTWGDFSTILASDFNNDGKVDLVSGGFVLLNDGNANFTLRESSNALGTAAADFNGDGIVDLVGLGVSNYGTDFYSTFRLSYGLGNAQFAAPTNLPPLGSATSVVTADFNNDGRFDIASAQPYSNQITVSLQKTDGTFTLPSTPVFAGGGSSGRFSVVATGDFNNDGNVDLATFVWWQRSAIILINNGSGQFTTVSVRINTQFQFTPQFIQTGDFNNDGKTDLVIVSDGAYVIVLNNGNNNFSNAEPIFLGSQSGFSTVAVGDFNGDGKSDLAISRAGLGVPIFHGKGDGTFVAAGSVAWPQDVSMVRSADLNADNRTDLVITSGGSYTGGIPGLKVFIANSSGGFLQTTYPVTGGPNDITFADFDTDGKKDFLLTNSPANAVTLYKGDGSGSFTPQTPISTIENIYGSATADFNRDLKPDLVLVSAFGPTAVFYNETPKAPCLTVNDTLVTEGNSATRNAQFTVGLSAPATQAVTVEYRVVGRNAANNADFTSSSGKLEFLPGTQTQTVNIPINGDTIDEVDETFQLVLSNSVNASLIDNIGVATIVDDDSAPSVSISDVTVVEGSGGTLRQLIFNVLLSTPTGRKATFEFTTLDGTALASTDYNSSGGTVVFNPGESTKQIVVAIQPDAFVEADETLKIKLSKPSDLVISDDEAIGTIVNDDIGGTIQFESAVIETTEASDTVLVNVRRTGGNAGGIVLVYSTSNGTATVNKDYLPSAGKMFFAANETVKSFVIPMLNDSIDESSPETVNLKLESISGGAILGAQSTAVLNITDDDPSPTLTSNGVSVNEGNTGTIIVNFSVRLLAVSGQTVTVNFATSNGTANAPEDFQNASGTLTFLPGETTKTISVSVRGDSQIEPNETFFLNLSSPLNAVLPNSQIVGTIVNDDSNARRANGDFDGDGKTDVAVFRPDAGNWFYLQSSDDAFRSVQFGLIGDRIAPGDYDGDGKTDYAVFRPSNGVWYILQSRAGFTAAQFGIAEDLPVQGDFDGDGKTDIAVFRPSSGTWYLLQSTAGFAAVPFGLSTDKPVRGDFDGDGKADIAVFRPSNGTWYRFNSSNNQFVAVQFGISEDKPIAADYDGDGKTDIAVFRPSNGTWYLLQSTAGFRGVQWGIETDQPVPGDYDGDSKTDIAVFRPSNGNWYLVLSSGAHRVPSFGAGNDVAVPSGYHPR